MRRYGKSLAYQVVMLIILLWGTQALALPSFTTGVADWSAQLSDGVNVMSADLTTDPHFSLNGNRATITYADLMDPYWTLTLSQMMAADQLLGSGYKLNFSFFMQVGLGDGGTFDGHLISATLGADALVNTTDTATQSRLLNGDTFTMDITGYAGSSQLLAFSLGDLDWTVVDYLMIGDFAFTQIAPTGDPAAPVPEPGTMVLLGVGLAGLAVYRKRCA